ncbi:MAG TPA: bifunctional phosphoglucose/phosphomannose isomerase [Thermoplasmata archaeon]|nr:bifunctional phosphoglucose/phosphomannose isomerase [Thermoplasmata archaeon]
MLEPETVAKVDKGGMRDIIASFPEQLTEGMRAKLEFASELGRANRVFIVGMGGSGIAGEVFAAWVADRSRIPIHPVHDYRLPSYVTPGDLLVAVSYSGDTEETLAATAQGIKLGCRIVAVTSGGALAKLAREVRAPLVEIPAGLPPRGAFGHLFGVLPSLGAEWVSGNLRGELEAATVHLRELRGRLRPESPLRRNLAKQLATKLRAVTPIVYGAPPYDAIAKRWQTQLNENAKLMSFSSSLPEADHNEIIGWASDASARRFAAILLRDADERPEIRRRLDATATLFARYARVEEVRDDDSQLLGRMLGTLFLGDYVSLYLATLRRVDPWPVEPIRELKERLKRLPRGKS